MCQHCEDPPCVDVCPTGASFKRADGIVLVDRHICIGCRYCMMACPYEARNFVHEDITGQKLYAPRGKGTAEACTMCVHRVDAGRSRPASRPAARSGTRPWCSGTFTTPTAKSTSVPPPTVPRVSARICISIRRSATRGSEEMHGSSNYQYCAGYSLRSWLVLGGFAVPCRARRGGRDLYGIRGPLGHRHVEPRALGAAARVRLLLHHFGLWGSERRLSARCSIRMNTSRSARLSAALAFALLAGGLSVVVFDLGRTDRLMITLAYINPGRSSRGTC